MVFKYNLDDRQEAERQMVISSAVQRVEPGVGPPACSVPCYWPPQPCRRHILLSLSLCSQRSCSDTQQKPRLFFKILPTHAHSLTSVVPQLGLIDLARCSRPEMFKCDPCGVFLIYFRSQNAG